MRTKKQKAAWSKLSPWMKRHIKKQPLSQWARRIKREFLYKCARCNKKSTLEAHHIYQKHLYPKLEQDLDNGICLCLKCHNYVHSIYKDIDSYFQEITKFLGVRKPLKSLTKKKRNPSLHKYKEYIYLDNSLFS